MTTAAETPETRVRRLRMRSMRRGIKEMDLILQAFAADNLATMSDEALDLYEALLAESDLEIYGWIAGQAAPPEVYAPLIARIRDGARGIVRPA